MKIDGGFKGIFGFYIFYILRTPNQIKKNILFLLWLRQNMLRMLIAYTACAI
jgi:hypothetical protein